MSRFLKPPKPLPDPVVLRDDREKRPWKLPWTVKIKRLKCGDYSVEGYKEVLAIEKKSGLLELLADLTNGYRPTFKRFLNRLSKYPVKIIVVCEPLNTGTVKYALKVLSKKSKGKSQLTARTIEYWVKEITCYYQIPVIFLERQNQMEQLAEIFRACQRKAEELK